MSDERRAKLPGFPAVTDANLAQIVRLLVERAEVREGARGSDLERVVTQRDLQNGGFVRSTGQRAGSSFAGVMVTGSDGAVGSLPFSVFESELTKTKLYANLLKRLDDVTRFDDVPEKVRNLPLNDLSAEAAKRGADIQRVEYKLQSAEESIAYTMQEVTAAVANASAGVREVTYASATANTATAGKITQLVAALDGTGSASLEESLVVIADRTEGLRSQFMIQVNAGKAVGGIGLMASEDPDGTTKSAFIVQADDFGLIGTVTFAQAATPTATAIGQTWYNTTTDAYLRATATGTGSWVAFTPVVPFGVDTVTGTTYINGSLRINAGGATIADSVGKYTDYIFKRSASAPTTPTGDTPAGWFDTPPTGTDPLYMSLADKTAAGVLIGVWSTPARLDGAAGTNGVNGGVGATGADGVTTYTWIAYANNSTGSSGFTTGGWSSHTYIGLATNKTTATESTNAADYTWALIKGEQGATGATGATGTNGTNGTNGTAGVRGSVARYLVGASWSDAAANAALPGGSPISGDIVTIGSGSFISTKTYNGSSWNPPGVIIDGSLIATGSITASAMFANTFTGYTFTGSVFQTASTGARVVINASSNNMLQVYNASALACELGGSSGVIWATSNSSLSSTISGVATGTLHGISGAGGSGAGGYFRSTSGRGVDTSGAIGTYSAGSTYAIQAAGQIYQANGGTAGQWNNYTNSVLPVADNAFYCGYTGNVWAGIYSQTAVVVTSDARKKTDIEDCDLGLAFIDALRPVTYRMLEGRQEATFAPGEDANTKDASGELVKPTITVKPGSRRHYGLLAQEVKAAIGDLDCGFWTIADVSDAESAQGLRYEELIAPMLKAIQELSARVKQLETPT